MYSVVGDEAGGRAASQGGRVVCHLYGVLGVNCGVLGVVSPDLQVIVVVGCWWFVGNCNGREPRGVI